MSLIAFIIGAGPGVGRHVANKLKAEGYKVALGSRHPDTEQQTKDGFFPVAVDTVDSKSIENAFHTVKTSLGIPNVVIYNVSTFTPLPTEGDPFTIPLTQVQQDVHVGGLGIYTAIHASITGFRGIPQTSPRVFIATGGIFPFVPPQPPYVTLQLQKNTAAFLVQLASLSYSKEGSRFYFASQVSSSGEFPIGEFDPAAHAIVYWDLLQKKDQGDWDVRFIKDGTAYHHK